MESLNIFLNLKKKKEKNDIFVNYIEDLKKIISNLKENDKNIEFNNTLDTPHTVAICLYFLNVLKTSLEKNKEDSSSIIRAVEKMMQFLENKKTNLQNKKIEDKVRNSKTIKVKKKKKKVQQIQMIF